MRFLFWFLSGLLVLSDISVCAQKDTTGKKDHQRRKVILSGTVGGLTIGSLVGLNQVWYSQYNTGRFHFFNDNGEWLQMDKAGHVYTTYQTSRVLMDAFEWAGYSRKKKIWLGGGISFLYLTSIEIMDGYSRGWGYSWGDQLADLAGSALAMSQEAVWGRQRIHLKFSYAESGLARYNPSLLGDSFSERLLKDYNGQTYWLSLSPVIFMSPGSAFPEWLHFSVGYGAYGMLGGHYNRILPQDEDGQVYSLDRTRRIYLSVDIDLTGIKTRSRLLRSVFSVLNILKFPAPALEFSTGGLRFYPIYY